MSTPNPSASRRQSRYLSSLTVCWLVFFLTINAAIGFASGTDGALTLSQPLTLAWRYQSDHTTDFTPAADANSVFVPLAGGTIVALNAADGKLRWRAEVGGDFSAAPCADDRSVYVATSYAGPDEKHLRGTLRAISSETGVTLWMRTLPAPLSGGLLADSIALFGGSVDGHVYAIDKRTGLILWSNQYAEEFSAHPTLAGSRVYFGSNAGVVRALDTKDGHVAWEYKTRGAVRGPIAVSGNVAFFGSDDGNVYAFSETRSKVLWHRRTGAAVQAVTAIENGVLAASLDNFAYLLSLNKGALIWRRQLPGRISSRPVTAPDGALFTPFSTDSAIVLNLRDGKHLNTLSLGEENSSAAAPIVVRNLVLITTPHGLLAFAAPRQ